MGNEMWRGKMTHRYTTVQLSLEMAHYFYFSSEATNNGMAIHHAVHLMTHTSLVMQPECQFKSKATEKNIFGPGEGNKNLLESFKRKTRYGTCILYYIKESLMILHHFVSGIKSNTD